MMEKYQYYQVGLWKILALILCHFTCALLLPSWECLQDSDCCQLLWRIRIRRTIETWAFLLLKVANLQLLILVVRLPGHFQSFCMNVEKEVVPNSHMCSIPNDWSIVWAADLRSLIAFCPPTILHATFQLSCDTSLIQEARHLSPQATSSD